MSTLEERVAALEAWRDRVEPHVNRTIPLGPGPKAFKEIEKQTTEAVKKIIEGIKKDAPPVDRSAVQLTSGDPVTEDHRQIKENGQQKDYVVLTPEERAKGFVRPVRTKYVHNKCGSVTTMGLAIAETYARDPKFYGGTFCCACGTHFPLNEFVWEGTKEMVGS